MFSFSLSIFKRINKPKKCITNIIIRSKSILDLVKPTNTVSLSISHMSVCRNIHRMQSISLTMKHISSRFVRFQLFTIHTYLASKSYLIYLFFQNSKFKISRNFFISFFVSNFCFVQLFFKKKSLALHGLLLFVELNINFVVISNAERMYFKMILSYKYACGVYCVVACLGNYKMF